MAVIKMALWDRWKLVVGAVAVVAIAFVLGAAFGIPGMSGIMAQEEADSELNFDLVVTPITPHPTWDLTQQPIRVEDTSGTPYVVETVAPATNVGTTRQPRSGRFLYLPKVGRYYSLPDDVELVSTLGIYSCYDEDCPIAPVRVYRRGKAMIAIDAVGNIFDELEGGQGDASAFPFFTEATE